MTATDPQPAVPKAKRRWYAVLGTVALVGMILWFAVGLLSGGRAGVK